MFHILDIFAHLSWLAFQDPLIGSTFLELRMSFFQCCPILVTLDKVHNSTCFNQCCTTFIFKQSHLSLLHALNLTLEVILPRLICKEIPQDDNHTWERISHACSPQLSHQCTPQNPIILKGSCTLNNIPLICLSKTSLTFN